MKSLHFHSCTNASRRQILTTPEEQWIVFRKLRILHICMYFNSNNQLLSVFTKCLDNNYDADMKSSNRFLFPISLLFPLVAADTSQHYEEQHDPTPVPDKFILDISYTAADSTKCSLSSMLTPNANWNPNICMCFLSEWGIKHTLDPKHLWPGAIILVKDGTIQKHELWNRVNCSMEFETRSNTAPRKAMQEL